MTSRSRLLPTLVLLATCGLAAQEHAGHANHEGAITYSREGQEHKTTVLGGALGSQSVGGVTVGLFVLQAESAERLDAAGAGPTHLFNVTFTDEATQRLLEQAEGTIVVTGSDGRRQREAIRPFRSHFQAALRLEHPGNYLVQVELARDGRELATRTFPFTYRRKTGTGAQDEAPDRHGHP